jgi:hypothetical protein
MGAFTIRMGISAIRMGIFPTRVGIFPTRLKKNSQPRCGRCREGRGDVV